MDDNNKQTVLHLEGRNSGVSPDNLSEIQAEIDKFADMPPEELQALEKKFLRKIDYTLLPTCFLLLILNYLDRNALASARVQGIEADLGMKGTDFNMAISLLFVGYILGQIPSNMILTRARPSIYLSCCVALWGAVSLCTGFVKNFHQLVAVRILLGFTESPYFPGALFLLSSWYTKKELAFRTAFLYCGSFVSGAFSGFISAGIQAGLDGAHGYRSWRWLFIIEGGITIFVAVLCIFVLPDYPATTRRLSVQERAIAVWRMERDAGSKDEEDEGVFHSLKLALGDYRLYILAFVIITKTTAGAVTQFIPTVVQTFGFSKVNTLLLTAPPYMFTLVLSLIVSRSSDRKPERCLHLALPLTFGLIGYIIAASTLNTAARYTSLFFMVGGLFSSYNVALAWIGSTFPRPRAKRASAYAIINSLGNIAQIWSPYLYPQTQAPRYKMAFATNSGMAAAAIVGCFVLRWCLARDNAAMDRAEALDTEKSFDDDSTGPVIKRPRYVL